MEKEKEVPDDFLKIIYEIIEQIYNNKELHKKNKNKKVSGFLVKKNVFDEFKEYICYKDLVKCVKDKKIFANFIKSINTMKKNIKFQKLEKQITFTKFDNTQELVNDLRTNHNEYYIINNYYGNKIIELQKQKFEKKKEKERQKFEIEKEKEKEKEKGIEYKITNDNIYIYFKNNDNVTFKFNKNILINESYLLESKQNLIDNKIEELKNANTINKGEKINQNENDSNEQIEKFKKKI